LSTSICPSFFYQGEDLIKSGHFYLGESGHYYFALTVRAFERRLNQQRPRRTVQQEANACGLDWGGVTISPPDRVHFLLR